MKKIYFLLAVLTLLSCGTTQLVQTSGTPAPPPPPVPAPIGGPEGYKAKVDDVNAISGRTAQFTDANRIGEMMNFLASDALKGRDSGSEGIAEAATFIETRFKEDGVAPYFNSYRDTLVNFGLPAYNIVGLVEGNDPDLKKEFILIGAHYDHIGILAPVGTDSIANGANDNASGTSSVLEIARFFGAKKTNKRSLIFALFSAEEKGLSGSKHLAKKLKSEGLNLYTMLNFEMTGVPLIGTEYLLYLTGYEKSNLAQVSNTHLTKNLVGFLPTAKELSLFQRSDNYPFYLEFGVPSHTYFSFDFTNFDHYHKVGDELALMDFNHMAKVVNTVLPMIEGIANSPTQVVTSKE